MGPVAAMDYVSEGFGGLSAAMVFYETGVENLEVFTNLPESAFRLEDDAYLRASATGEQGEICYTGSLFNDKENGGVP